MPRDVRPSELQHTLTRSLERGATLDLIAVCDQLRDWTAPTTTTGGLSGQPSGAGHIADPTGNAALQTTHDYPTTQRTRIEHHVRTIAASINALVKIAELTTNPPPLPDPADRGLVICANIHGCPDDAWATKAGRCEACYRHRLRHDTDRRLSGQPRTGDA